VILDVGGRCKRGLANLIQDLHARAMDQDMVTGMWG
jgi:hypothetical protein